MNETALQMHRRQRLGLAVDHLTAGNVAAFGRLLGYRDGAFVRQMLTGSRAVSDKTARAIEALRGMEGWFGSASAAGTGEADPAAESLPVVSLRTIVPILRAGVPGYGVPSTNGEDTQAESGTPQALFPRAWLQRRGLREHQLLALRMADGSMRPSLHPGDVVTVDTGQVEPLDGQVFAVNYEGACLLRRLVRDGGAWWLAADDHLRFPRKQLLPPAAVLIGRAVHLDSTLF